MERKPYVETWRSIKKEAGTNGASENYETELALKRECDDHELSKSINNVRTYLRYVIDYDNSTLSLFPKFIDCN